MVIYVMKADKPKLIHRIFNILKIKNIDNKTIIYLPIKEKNKERNIKRIFKKLSKYCYINNIKTIVLEQQIMNNEVAKNILYSNNINILDGTKINRFLTNNLIEKIYEYKNKKIETGEITILVNDNDDINTHIITVLTEKIKRLNIITNNTQKFRKMVEKLYDELGILIKLSSNMKTNIKNADILVNIDFSEELINQLDIPINATILNIPQDININSKKFSGINIKKWEVEIPNEYKIDKFDEKIIYEIGIYGKSTTQIFEQIKKDNLKIKYFIGVNGMIRQKEFINLKKYT